MKARFSIPSYEEVHKAKIEKAPSLFKSKGSIVSQNFTAASSENVFEASPVTEATKISSSSSNQESTVAQPFLVQNENVNSRNNYKTVTNKILVNRCQVFHLKSSISILESITSIYLSLEHIYVYAWHFRKEIEFSIIYITFLGNMQISFLIIKWGRIFVLYF